MSGIAPGTWYAIAAERDLPPGHIYRTILGGHELAVWRADDGSVQVWDDRCPHRGVRFSLGEVVGDELRCQYHAWRFGKTGACSFIPAQPDLKVPASIHANVWPVALAGGLVWSGIAPEGAPPQLPAGAVLRAIPVKRAATLVAQAAAALPTLALTIQPLDDAMAMIRGIAPDGDLTRADQALVALRRQLERAA